MEIKKCCLFNKSEIEFKDNKDFIVIKKYGEIPAPNECTRSLLKCNKCGAMFLYQFLEWNDSYYNDYIQVENEEQADKLNEKLTFEKFNTNSNPMIKIGSDKKVCFQLPKSNPRARQIIDALSDKDQDRLKELKVSNEEINSILESIDKRIEKLDSEILEYISNVENEINYIFSKEYKDYLLKHSVLKPDKNILGLSNGGEKLIRYFYSMDPNSKIYILKFRSFDSDLKDKIIPFAELEFGDTLCFERETNKIGIYNHEADTFDIIADDWNTFIKELYDDSVYKTKNGFEYKYKGLKVIITADEIKEELTNYADEIIEYYFKNKDNVINHLLEKFEKDNWYVETYTREEIVEKMGKPTIYVNKVDYGELAYLDSKLDEHLITVELYRLKISGITIDG